MTKYGATRVSTKGQQRYGCSLEEQVETLLAAGVKKENIYSDTYTGTKVDRPGLNKLLSVIQPGDELVVCKLDRLARTAAEGSLLIRDLVDRGIRVNILNMGVADNTPMGKVMVTVMLAFAEFERDMIVERTSAGKAYKREHDPDFREGRPRKKVSGYSEISEKNKKGLITVDEACKELGISRTQWYRLKKEIGVR